MRLPGRPASATQGQWRKPSWRELICGGRDSGALLDGRARLVLQVKRMRFGDARSTPLRPRLQDLQRSVESACAHCDGAHLKTGS